MKKILSLILIGLLCFALVGCGNKDKDCSKIKDEEEKEACLMNQNKNNKKDDDNNNDDKNNPSGESGYQRLERFLAGDYWISYIANSNDDPNTDSATIEVRKNASGVYMILGNMESLFIKNGNTYDFYGRDNDEKFINMGPLYDNDHVEDQARRTAFYVTTLDNYETLKKLGEETIAGRECGKYTQANYTYWVDKATGIVLKVYTVDNNGQKTGIEYEATIFKTEGVILPEHN